MPYRLPHPTHDQQGSLQTGLDADSYLSPTWCGPLKGSCYSISMDDTFTDTNSSAASKWLLCCNPNLEDHCWLGASITCLLPTNCNVASLLWLSRQVLNTFPITGWSPEVLQAGSLWNYPMSLLTGALQADANMVVPRVEPRQLLHFDPAPLDPYRMLIPPWHCFFMSRDADTIRVAPP